MTDKEKAIVMAYTGICMLTGKKLSVFYQYLEKLYGRPVYTHEWMTLDIKEKSKSDFLQLCKKNVTQPQYEELTPEEVASEIASGNIISAWDWLDVMVQLKQMGYVICRKR